MLFKSICILLILKQSLTFNLPEKGQKLFDFYNIKYPFCDSYHYPGKDCEIIKVHFDNLLNLNQLDLKFKQFSAKISKRKTLKIDDHYLTEFEVMGKDFEYQNVVIMYNENQNLFASILIYAHVPYHFLIRQFPHNISVLILIHEGRRNSARSLTLEDIPQ